MLKKALLFITVFVTLVSSTTLLVLAEDPKEITVSAAISMKNAFEEIGKLYESRNKGIRVLLNFGASGDLARQIEAGAPVDVFVSAVLKDMEDLDRQGLIMKTTKSNFARNSVVLIIPRQSKLAITKFSDLKRPEVKKIAIGNPKTVPAGRYAEEVIKHYGILDSMKEKLIFGENVRQVLDYVARGEVDIGFVYGTDASIRSKDIKIVMKAPEDSHSPVIYPIAVVKGTKNDGAARKFISLVTSSDGRAILEKYGFKATK